VYDDTVTGIRLLLQQWRLTLHALQHIQYRRQITATEVAKGRRICDGSCPTQDKYGKDECYFQKKKR
jgi:hypothetical protein